VGTYRNSYVGDIKIVRQNGKLDIVEGPNHMRFTLEHLDGDTFIYKHDPELPDYPAKVKFTVGPNGVATALTDSAFMSPRRTRPRHSISLSARVRPDGEIGVSRD
jgi:hypothetical protein